MLTGIGLLIILKQIPHALGWDKDVEGDDAFLQADGQNTFSEIGEGTGFYYTRSCFDSRHFIGYTDIVGCGVNQKA